MARLMQIPASRLLLAVCIILGCSAASADDNRARVNYMLQCQGCHMPDARGADKAVPRLRDFVGYFTHSQEGREFLIRVPGVATSSLANEELAELMNWILRTYSASQLPDDFVPYDAKEIEALRTEPDRDPLTHRIPILDRLAISLPQLDRVLKSGDYAY